MRLNLVSGGWTRNSPWGTEHAFAKYLQADGHTVTRVHTGETDFSFDRDADVSVCFKDVKDRVADELLKFRGVKVVFQPDDIRFPDTREDMSYMRQLCDHALVFEPDGIGVATDELGYKRVARVMIPVDADIYRPNVNFAKVFDVCFVGNMSREPRHASRWKMRRIIAEELPNVRSVFMTQFGVSVINQWYNQSRIVLHHATDVGQEFGTGYGYQSRHFEAGYSGACVLSNEVLNEERMPGLNVFTSERDLVSQVRRLLKDDTWKRGAEFHDHLVMSQHSLSCARALVRFVQESL